MLDNDVVLDFLLTRQPFFIEADEIFVRLQNKEFRAYISAITPINAFYTIRKEKGKDVAFSAVKDFLNLVEVAKTNKQILQNAFSLNFTDYEDAVQ